MPMTIEQIRSKVEETQTQIDKSSELTPEQKVEKAKELESTISKIKTDLDSLRANTEDADVIKAIDELEAEYETLNSDFEAKFKQELEDLEDEVVDNDSNEDRKDIIEKEEKEKQGDRSWLRRQVDGMGEKEDWKNGKNIARVAGGIGAVWLGSKIIKGIGRLFKGKDNKEESDNFDDDGNKKGFWKSGWGKALKFLGIGTAGFLGLRWLMTGKNPFEWGDVGLTAPPEDQVESYLDLMEDDPERFGKYESLGGHVNNMYDEVFAKEIASGRDNKTSLGQISINVIDKVKNMGAEKVYTGVVPYVLDENYSSINKILSEEGLKYQIWASDIATFKSKILSWGKKGISNIMGPFLGTLQSWATLGAKKGEGLEGKFERWADSGNPEDRVQELQLFFRQYMKVSTYLINKKHELQIMIAKEKFKTNPAEFDTYEEAMKDGHWFEYNVEKDPRYSQYLNGKIDDAEGHLSNLGIEAGTLMPEQKEIIDDLDDQRDNILYFDGTKDILQISEEDMADGSLESGNKTKLTQSCDAIYKDIEEEVEENLKETCRTIYGKLLNTEESAKETFLKESGLDMFFVGFKSYLTEIKQKISSGAITKEELFKFKDSINNYFALKKEMVIGAQTMQITIDENGNPIIRGLEFLFGCVGNIRKSMTLFWDGEWGQGAMYLVTGLAPLVLVARGVRYLRLTKGGPKLLLKDLGRIKNLATVPITGSLHLPTVLGGKYRGPASMLKNRIFNGVDGSKKLEAAFIDGKISLDKASKVVKAGQNKIYTIDKKVRMKRQGYGTNANSIKQSLIKANNNIIGIYDNDANIKYVVDYFDNKNFNRLILSGDNQEEVMDVLKKYDGKLKSGYPKMKKDLLKKIVDNNNLSLDDINKVFDKLDVLDSNKISTTNINSLSKKIGKNISDIDDINKFVDNYTDDVIESTTKLDPKVAKIIDQDIAIFEGKKTTTMTETAKDLNKYYDTQIKRLEGFKSSLNSGGEDSIKMFNKLDGMGIKPRHMADLFEISSKDAKLFDEFKLKLDAGDSASYLKYLNEKKGYKILNDTITQFKKIDAGTLLKNGDEAFTGLFKLVKMLARFT